MGNVIRLTNGSTVMVRTGILAGVGPQGPRGLVGPQGPDGAQGPKGDTGPPGSITQYASRFYTSTQSLSASTETPVAFASVGYDDMGVQLNTTTWGAPEGAAGDYLYDATLFLADYGTNGRIIAYIVSNMNGRMGGAQITLGTWNTALQTPLHVSYLARATEFETFQIKLIADSTDTTITVTANSVLSITKCGPGPQGPPGPTGPAGSTGPAGATGATGPAGSAGSGYATYDDLLP